MTAFIWNTCAFILLIGILVAVHEFGHFWVARRCGVKVHRFSIGFGKAIWRRTGKDGTEYVLAIIPLGGYVKMLDARNEQVPDELLGQEFTHKPLWQRSAIVAAGPIANFLLAFFVYWLSFLIGIPSLKPIVEGTEPNSVVSAIEISSPMELTAVNDIQTRDWDEVNLALVQQIGEPQLTLTLTNAAGQSQSYVVNLANWQFEPDQESAISALGLKPFQPQVIPELGLISANSAAEKAGLKVGDHIVAVNQMPLKDWSSFVQVIQNSPNQLVQLTIERDGQTLHVDLTPTPETRNDKLIGLAGVQPMFEPYPKAYQFERQYGPLVALGKAFDKTLKMTEFTFSMIGKLFRGDIGLNNLSGPVSIAQGAGITADYGLVFFLSFMALISINLGIVNLLPLPVLDGGHLLFFAIEGVIRRPVPEKIQEIGFRLGATLLIMMMVLALYNDFFRLLKP
ncbi:Regulator of sigma-E protease RseP [Vibrio stylophorae]|uniref:Zinc metalloprotease n=1 Tax=Vibrio stylophorae TaxID=659351 RepID=A0ABM8ZV79_9VIBR|nr:sigma E protease regulator RseP [Vibrio stylophorae]CAH0534229.1 Regulator of sigma-E protease RseP [Vibrio stylophorae]